MVLAFNPDVEKICIDQFRNTLMIIQYWELAYHNETV